MFWNLCEISTQGMLSDNLLVRVVFISQTARRERIKRRNVRRDFYIIICVHNHTSTYDQASNSFDLFSVSFWTRMHSLSVRKASSFVDD